MRGFDLWVVAETLPRGRVREHAGARALPSVVKGCGVVEPTRGSDPAAAEQTVSTQRTEKRGGGASSNKLGVVGSFGPAIGVENILNGQILVQFLPMNSETTPDQLPLLALCGTGIPC